MSIQNHINLPIATNIQNDSSFPISHVVMKCGNEMSCHIIVDLPLVTLAVNRYYFICDKFGD